MLQDWLENGQIAGLVAVSQPGREMLLQATRAATVDHPLLIGGAAGTGKRSLGRAVHRLSPRSGRVHCLSLDREPEQDHLGTLFDGPTPLWKLDPQDTLILAHIEALSPPAQDALATALQSGGTHPRLISTCRLGAENNLAPALLHRLATLRIDVPTLAERTVDVELIADQHLRRAGVGPNGEPWTLTFDAHRALRRQRWLGHITELIERLDRAMREATTSELSAEDLLLHAANTTPLRPVQAMERDVVRSALAQLDGNVTEAGRRLGIPRSTLYRKLKKWGMR